RYVNGQAAEVIADELALPGVEPSPQLDSQLAGLPTDRARTSDRARGAVEAHEEAITRLLYLAAPEARELCADQRVVALAQLSPRAVAKLGGTPGGIDDVSEKHRRKHADRRSHRP